MSNKSSEIIIFLLTFGNSIKIKIRKEFKDESSFKLPLTQFACRVLMIDLIKLLSDNWQIGILKRDYTIIDVHRITFTTSSLWINAI